MADRIAVIDRGWIVAMDTPGALKSAAGGDLITLATADRHAAAAEIRARYGVAPTLANGTVSFQVPAGETFLPEFVRGFGQPLEAISLRRPTLNDVFLHLTGREIRDQHARDSDPGAANGRRR